MVVPTEAGSPTLEWGISVGSIFTDDGRGGSKDGHIGGVSVSVVGMRGA